MVSAWSLYNSFHFSKFSLLLLFFARLAHMLVCTKKHLLLVSQQVRKLSVLAFHLDMAFLFRAKAAENSFPCHLQLNLDFPVHQVLSCVVSVVGVTWHLQRSRGAGQKVPPRAEGDCQKCICHLGTRPSVLEF